MTVPVVLSLLAALAPCLPAVLSICSTLLMVPPPLYSLLVMEVLGGRHWRGSREIRSSSTSMAAQRARPLLPSQAPRVDGVPWQPSPRGHHRGAVAWYNSLFQVPSRLRL